MDNERHTYTVDDSKRDSLSFSDSHFIHDLLHSFDVDLIVEWALAFALLIFSYVWVGYHIFCGYHYKYQFDVLSHITIVLHIIVGSAEFFFLTGAYFFCYGVAEYMAYAAGACDIIHAMTAYRLMFSSAGQKIVTLPAYAWAITGKLCFAILLIVNPLSRGWLLCLFFAHAQFTFLRLLYLVFEQLHVFHASLYSAAMVVCALVLQPFIYGEAGNCFFLIYLFISIALLKWLKPTFIVGWTTEARRDIAYFLTDEQISKLRADLAACENWEQKCDVLFDHVDVDGGGTVTLDELFNFLRSTGVTVAHAYKIFNSLDSDKSGDVSRDEFRSHRAMQAFVKMVENDLVFDMRARTARKMDSHYAFAGEEEPEAETAELGGTGAKEAPAEYMPLLGTDRKEPK